MSGVRKYYYEAALAKGYSGATLKKMSTRQIYNLTHHSLPTTRLTPSEEMELNKYIGRVK